MMTMMMMRVVLSAWTLVGVGVAQEAPPCTDMMSMQTGYMSGVMDECCDEPTEDCSSGFPATCNADCATVLLPMQEACEGFLSSSPLWIGTKSVVDEAAANCPVATVPPPPPPAPLQDCNNFGQLQQLLGPINDACCTGAVDCSTGMPETCDDSCASVLLPFAASCAAFLQLPMNAGMKTIIDAVVGTCRVPPSLGPPPPPPPGPCFPNPCQNGGWCRGSTAAGVGSGSPTAYTCSCAAGFSGADCADGQAEEPWCHVELPSVPETLQSWFDTGNWIQAATIAHFYTSQAAGLDWSGLHAPRTSCNWHGVANYSASVDLPWGAGETNRERYENMDALLNPDSTSFCTSSGSWAMQQCAQLAEFGMPCAWGWSEQRCREYANNGYGSFSEYDCSNGGAGLSDYDRRYYSDDFYTCLQTARLPPYQCERDTGYSYCVGDVVRDPDYIPHDAMHALQAGLAGFAEGCRLFAAALPPTLFPNGLPTTMLDFTEWFKRALFEDLQAAAGQSAASMSAYSELDLTAALSTLEGQEVCASEEGLDDFQAVTDGLIKTAFDIFHDGVTAWNGESLPGPNGEAPVRPPVKPPVPPPPPPGETCTLSGGLPLLDIATGMPSIFAEPIAFITTISDLATDKLLTRKLSAVLSQFGFVPWSLRVDGETVIEHDEGDEINIMLGRMADALNGISQGLPDTPPIRTRTEGPLDLYRWVEDLADLDWNRFGRQCSMTAHALQAVDWWTIASIALPNEEDFQRSPEQEDLDQINLPFDAIAGVCDKLSQNMPSGAPQPDGQCKTGFFSLTDFIFANLDNAKMSIAATELAKLLRVWSQTDWTLAYPPTIVQMLIDDGRTGVVCPAIEGFAASLVPSAETPGCQAATRAGCIEKLMDYEPCTIMNVGEQDGGIYSPDGSYFDGVHGGNYYDYDTQYFDSYRLANGQGIPLPAGGNMTVEMGTGTICPALQSVHYNPNSGLCCKVAGADGSCSSWCRPGAMDCVDQDNPESTIISQEDSETMQNFCLAAAVALEQYAAAIPETDDIPAESPWNLNDWIVDFANGGTLGWTALNTQVDDFLNALDLVDWDNALYALSGDHSSDEAATEVDAGLELAAEFLSKHRPQSGGAPAPTPTCINAFSLSSLPDLLAANLDPQKMKAGLGALADLADRLMRVDWSATTENMPTCDTSQPLSRCADFTTSSACEVAFDDGEPTRDDFYSCYFAEFYDENYNSIITQDGERLGTCYAGGYDIAHSECQNNCEELSYRQFNVNHTAVVDCYAACDTDYTLCTHQIPTHAEVIARDVSDEINYQVLANVRDFLSQIVNALPDTGTKPPGGLQPNTAMDFFGWLESSSDPAKWSDVAEQAGVILAALDDVDLEPTYVRICREVAATYEAGDHNSPDCDGPDAEISEKTLLEIQVFFDVARDMASKIAAALDGNGH